MHPKDFGLGRLLWISMRIFFKLIAIEITSVQPRSFGFEKV